MCQSCCARQQKHQIAPGPTRLFDCGLPCACAVQSEANDKFNELEEQLQQIKDQIKVGATSAASSCAAQLALCACARARCGSCMRSAHLVDV
jgi:hypothetical protein